jgi:hypothetical protein
MRRLLERAIGLSFQGPVNVVRCAEPEDLTLVTDPDGWRPRFERQMGEPFECSLGRFERTLSRGRTAKPLA